MKLSHLSARPDLCDEIARLLYAEWSPYYMLGNINSIEKLSELLKTKYTNINYFPMGFVVTDNDKLVSYASVGINGAIKEEPDLLEDTAPKKNYKIWLADVYVVKEYRNKGISKEMINNIIKIMKEKYNIPKLYLWVDNIKKGKFYEGLGFVQENTMIYEGYNFTIYKKDLNEEESLIKPVHLIGLFVLIVFIYFIRKIFQLIFWLLFGSSNTNN
jgi:GNAT superfamily N-acetyltransferase